MAALTDTTASHSQIHLHHALCAGQAVNHVTVPAGCVYLPDVQVRCNSSTSTSSSASTSTSNQAMSSAACLPTQGWCMQLHQLCS